MADTVTSRTLRDGDKYVIMAFTNASDGTGESAVKKVDVSALTPAAASVVIEEIWFDVSGMIVKVLEDATTDVVVLALQGNNYIDLRSIGGIPNSAASGYTGDILFTTSGHTAGDSYNIIIKMRKKY